MVAYESVGPAGGAGATGTGTSPLAWTHTTSGTNRVLVAWCAFDSCAAAVSATATCTKGGTATAMTSLGTVFSGSQTAGYIQGWKIINPDSGACTVTVSWTGTSPSSTHGCSVNATAASDAGTPVLLPSSGLVTTGSVVVPGTTAGNLVAAGVTCGSDGLAFTAGTGRSNAGNTGTGAAGDMCAATLAAPGGSATISWTQGNDYFGAIAVQILAAATGTPAGLASGTGAALNPSIMTSNVTVGPEYAGTASDLGGGAGSWATPQYAEGGP